MHRFYCCMLLVVAIALVASPALAATTGSNEPLSSLQTVVSDLYSYSLKIVGLCVFVMFLIAGLGYIIPESIRPKFMSNPIGIIQDAVIGLVLLFSAYLIFNTINPDLVGNGGGVGTSSSTTTVAQQFPTVPQRTPLPPTATVIYPPAAGDTNHNGVYVLNGILNNDDLRVLTIYVDGAIMGTVGAGQKFTMSRLPPGTVTYTH